MPGSSNGLSALPDELLFEIISHFPPDPLTLAPASTTQIARREMLASLSEVCQNLHRVFRPCLWQRVEVYAGMRVASNVRRQCLSIRNRTRNFTNELLRQLNVVTVQDPTLAQYIRTVDIEINAAFYAVLTELGRCFSFFPNLHSVKMRTVSLSSIDASKVALSVARHGFKRSVLYPQIRSAVLSWTAFPLITVCPRLESLTSEEFPLILTYMKGKTTLNTLHCPLHPTTAEVIGVELPTLQRITIIAQNSTDFPMLLLKTIRPFKNLKTLFLRYISMGRISKNRLKQTFLNLSPHDRQNLKEVIFLGYSLPTAPEEIFTLPPF